MENNSFFIIPGFAASELHLSGNDLLIYSLIFSYKKAVYLSYSYIAKRVNCTRRSAINSIRYLIDQDLIIAENVPTGFHNLLKINGEKISPSGEKISLLSEKILLSSEKFSHNNNKYNNKSNNKIYSGFAPCERVSDYGMEKSIIDPESHARFLAQLDIIDEIV